MPIEIAKRDYSLTGRDGKLVCVAKTPSGSRIKQLSRAPGWTPMLYIRSHDPIFRRLPHLPQRLFPFPLPPRDRDPCSASAVGRIQAKTSSPSLAYPGSNILGSAPPVLACMEEHPGHRQTRNRCRLASHGLSFVLADSISYRKQRQTKNRYPVTAFDPTNGIGESNLGRTANSRRTSQARL